MARFRRLRRRPSANYTTRRLRLPGLASSENMHRLLTRQVRRHLNGEAPELLQTFLAAVDEAYTGFDADRLVCERSLDISSRELMARHEESTRRNAELQILKKELEVRVGERTRELRSANEQLRL